MTGRLSGTMIQDASVGTAQIADNAVIPGKQSADGRLPPGSMAMFAGAAAPTGWLLCNGAAVNRTTNAALFAAIGTTWGAGDGSTTFNVPDLRGRAPIGAGTGAGLTARTLAATGGAETHQLTIAEMPAHTHTVGAGGSGGGGRSDGGSTNTVSSGSQGGGAAHNNMQPFAVVNFIIKT